MESIFLRDFAVVVAAAAGMALICHWLRQPAVIGYLLAGLIIGPHTPPFSLVHDLHSIQTMAELGLVVLMFALGLEFSLPKLGRVGAKASLATILEIFGMLGVGYGIGRALGWSFNDSVYLGAILSISSTTIIIKVLTDLHLNHEAFAQIVFAILILEDVAAMVILAVLSGLGLRHENESLTILLASVRVFFFVAVFLIIGLAVIPRLMRRIGKLGSREMLGMAALGLCLGSALLAKQFGFSVALGSFLAGAVIAASAEAEVVETWIHPIRDLFSAIFFVSAGLMIDPRVLWSLKGAVALVAVATVVGKSLMGALGSFLVGFPLKAAFRIGMTLAQIGEFSFVFASLGSTTGLGSPFLFPLAVAVSAVTTLFTPYLIRGSHAAANGLLRIAPAWLTREFDTISEKPSRMAAQDGAGMLSRYVWRGASYAVLLAGGFLFTNRIDRLLARQGVGPAGRLAVWACSWIAEMPLIHALASYVNHFLLLSLTEMICKSRHARLLIKLPIQKIYDGAEIFLWIILAVLWIIQPVDLSRSAWLTAPWLAGMSLVALLSRGLIRTIHVRLESLLDEIMGLATSEPLRRAATAADGPHSLLNESIQRLMVPRGSSAVGCSLRELALRVRAGASVIGIYRNGTLSANPPPETTLQAGDILVVLGNREECRKAGTILSERRTPST